MFLTQSISECCIILSDIHMVENQTVQFSINDLNTWHLSLVCNFNTRHYSGSWAISQKPDWGCWKLPSNGLLFPRSKWPAFMWLKRSGYWLNFWYILISKGTSGFMSNTLLIRIQYCYPFKYFTDLIKVMRRMVKWNVKCMYVIGQKTFENYEMFLVVFNHANTCTSMHSLVEIHNSLVRGWLQSYRYLEPNSLTTHYFFD